MTRVRRARRTSLVLVLALAAGCRAIDHKYWSLPVTTAIEEAEWKERHPKLNMILRTLACVVCDLPIYPVTFGHDVWAFFALPSRGKLPGHAPAPDVVPDEDDLPPKPPALLVEAVDPGPPPFEPEEEAPSPSLDASDIDAGEAIEILPQ